MYNKYKTFKLSTYLMTAFQSYYEQNKITQEQFDALNRLKKDLATKLAETERIMEIVSEDCPGEAHGNPYIDNCGICAPQWGKILKNNFTKE